MTTWSEIREELRELLEDTGAAPQFSDPLLLRSYNRAMDYFAVSHTAELIKAAITVTAVGDGGTYALPTDVIKIVGLETESDGWFVPLSPGQEDDQGRSGFIVLSDELLFPVGNPTGDLWYFKKYAHATADNSVITIPEWASWAVMNMAVAFALTPKMVGQALLRRFQQSKEAGNPIDNPPRNQADYHRMIYLEQVGAIKPQDREAFLV